MMEAENVMERSYDSLLVHEEIKIGGKLERKDVRMVKSENGGPYLVRDCIKITMDERA